MSTSPHHHCPDPQNLQTSFQVPDRSPCTVSITVEPATDPVRNGQGLLGLYSDPNVVKGYPVIRATVSSPQSRIYASLYGWIQVTNTPGEPWVMDLYPPFQGLNSPFIFWGSEPTLVDSPAREGVKNYDWTARSFLCYSPDAAMSKSVVPILGVEWGFWIEDGRPFVKELRNVDLKCWNEHIELFGNFQGWDFAKIGESSASQLDA